MRYHIFSKRIFPSVNIIIRRLFDVEGQVNNSMFLLKQLQYFVVYSIVSTFTDSFIYLVLFLLFAIYHFFSILT